MDTTARRVTIRDRRKAAKFSQRSLARALGVDLGTVINWEHGKNQPNAKYLPLLADLFGCSIDELFA